MYLWQIISAVVILCGGYKVFKVTQEACPALWNFLLPILIPVGLFVGFIGMDYYWTMTSPIEKSFYEEIVKGGKEFPQLVPMIETSLSDGVVTRFEYEAIRNKHAEYERKNLADDVLKKIKESETTAGPMRAVDQEPTPSLHVPPLVIPVQAKEEATAAAYWLAQHWQKDYPNSELAATSIKSLEDKFLDRDEWKQLEEMKEKIDKTKIKTEIAESLSAPPVETPKPDR